MGFSVDRIDHVVLNCRDVEATVAWYQRVLGMEREEFGKDRHTALKFGRQKFNVRPTGALDWWSVRTCPRRAGSLFHYLQTTTPSSSISRPVVSRLPKGQCNERCIGSYHLGLLLRSGR